MKLKQIFGKNIKYYRFQKNLTQKQIAEYLDITQSHYASYETGRNVIPITKLIKLSKLYNTSIDFLLDK